MESLRTVKRKGDYFYPLSYEKTTPRTVGDTRSIDFISHDEISGTMVVIASTCVGITKDALFAETARVYGFNRAGGKIQVALQFAYYQVFETGKAKEVDGKVSTD